MANHWLLKSEPEVYPFSQLVADGRTTWDGVRNFEARNNLAAMAEGDFVLFYHSHVAEIVGVAKVTRTAFPDPTADDPRWRAVELAAQYALDAPVSLETIKADRAFSGLKLVTHSRLSVMPVAPAQFARILELAKSGPRSAKTAAAAGSSRSRAGRSRSDSPSRRR
ncbi:MAG: EVE domain-containing protein [Myxococcota bacterium]